MKFSSNYYYHSILKFSTQIYINVSATSTVLLCNSNVYAGLDYARLYYKVVINSLTTVVLTTLKVL